jgi:hypothetical protein
MLPQPVGPGVYVAANEAAAAAREEFARKNPRYLDLYGLREAMEERKDPMNNIEVSAPAAGIALATATIPRSDPGYGSAYVAAIHQEARRRFPKATGFSIDYRGSRPKITPHYTRSATAGTSRRAGAGGSQQVRLAARLPGSSDAFGSGRWSAGTQVIHTSCARAHLRMDAV